jgi:hypothetical protein
MLPDPLPTDPDALESLYREFTRQDNLDQAEFDRLMAARLRSWGYDPQHITADQILGLMEESMNSLLVNLYGAAQAAPDDASRAHLTQIIERARELRGQIRQAFDGVPPPAPASDAT